MSPEQERHAFEEAIRADRYDQITRLAYGDWLEEHGLDDEAFVQHTWTIESEQEKEQAEQWLADYASRMQSDEDEGYYQGMTYEALIQAADNYLDRDERYCLPFDTPDHVWFDNEKFWRNFTLATGREVQKEKRSTFFRCAC